MIAARTIRGVTFTLEAVRFDGDYLYGPTLNLEVEPIAGRRIALRINVWHDRQGGVWHEDRDRHAFGVTAQLDISDSCPNADIPF